MKKFKHYILTRYNLGIYSKDNPYAATVGDPEKWMKHRAQLFKACYDSVMNQTCKDFEWIIAIDGATPFRWYRKLMSHERVIIVYTQPHQTLRYFDHEAEWLITTRLDNDDILHPDFVAKIQAQFDETTKLIDVHYEAVKDGVHYQSGRTRPNSPFLSLIEPWGENVMTALGRPHTVMCEQYPAVWLPDVLAYQMIHDRNVSNKINGRPV